jgi:putative MATE family efflux protein
MAPETKHQRRTRPAEAAVHGSLARAIWRLAGPITLSQALFMLPNLYDSLWLGRLGNGAQAAAGLAMSVRVTMISVLMALSSASGAVVARYVGADDEDGANLATLQAVILMTVSSGVLGLIGFVFAEPLMRLAGADPEVLPTAVTYARVIFAGLIAMELLPSIGGMLNTAGAPEIRLTMMLCMLGTQLVAQPLLTQRFGLVGAAAAVVLGNAAGMSWGLGTLLSGRAALRLDIHHLRLDLPIMRRIVRVALPAVVQRGAPNLANSLLIRLIAAYGSPILGAWIVTTRVLGFVQVPGMGLSGAAAAMVGINLGADQVARAEKAVRVIARVALAITAVLVLFLLAAAPWVLSWFGLEAEALGPGTAMLRWVALGYLIQTVTLVHDAAQVGAGDTLSPMLVNLASLWLVQLPLAWLLSTVVGLGPPGIWWGLIVGWGVQAVLMVKRYQAARWQKQKI